jgi:putative spermidine/putrescine transport system permease protein
VRAARSLGASSWKAFRSIYFPLTIPGIAAGGLLVFILAVGYYITPALVGGASGQLISNLIAYHMTDSLNWSLAAALAAILLGAVLILYWLYDRLIGIDNLKLG